MIGVIAVKSKQNAVKRKANETGWAEKEKKKKKMKEKWLTCLSFSSWNNKVDKSALIW